MGEGVVGDKKVVQVGGHTSEKIARLAVTGRTTNHERVWPKKKPTTYACTANFPLAGVSLMESLLELRIHMQGRTECTLAEKVLNQRS